MTDPIVPVDDPRLEGLRRIVAVMDRLRGDGGCPWDREQDHQTLRPFLVEEAYELLEALDGGDSNEVREELGDLLFQVVFHARVAEDEGRYHLGQVAEGIATKLLRRHPHVFEDPGSVPDSEQVSALWDELKRREGRSSALDGVPRALPALLRAQRVQEKAARVGFDWSDVQGPLDKLNEELGELRERVEAQDPEGIVDELGDLLFSAVNLARHLKVTPEDALRGTTARFERRFRHMEQLAGGDLKPLDADAMERLWEQAKATEPNT
jgi:MazG family protein